MTKDEIIKALRDMARYPTVTLPRDKEALKAAADLLAQPEQEPVQWGVDWGRAGDQSCVSIIKRKPNGGIEVVAVEYGPPAQRKPLTDEEINDIAKNYALNNPTTPLHFARAIEAAHGIQENT